MSDQSPVTPGADASTPGPEPAPGAPTEPTVGSAGPDAAAAASAAEVAGGTSADSAAAPSGPTPPGGPLDGEGATRSAPAPSDPDAAGRPNRRKVREGLVLSISMDKTAVVGVVDRVRHPRYVKTVQRTKRLYAHDDANQLRVGDRVRVAETRPLSKLKRWRVVEVLERAK